MVSSKYPYYWCGYRITHICFLSKRIFRSDSGYFNVECDICTKTFKTDQKLFKRHLKKQAMNHKSAWNVFWHPCVASMLTDQTNYYCRSRIYISKFTMRISKEEKFFAHNLPRSFQWLLLSSLLFRSVKHKENGDIGRHRWILHSLIRLFLGPLTEL